MNCSHHPSRFSSYITRYGNLLEDFAKRGFVKENDLLPVVLPKHLRLQGEVACRGEIVIRVQELFQVLGAAHNLVIRQRYAYNVSIATHGNVIRYDNRHPHGGHLDSHHKHTFDWRNRKELPNSPTWVSNGELLNLRDVLEEVFDWYLVNHNDLPNPDSFAQLNRRNRTPSLEL